MKTSAKWLVPLALAALSSTVSADPWKDESGKGRRGEHKQEYRDGNCKVERKWEKDGGYKEERKCKGSKHYAREGYREPDYRQQDYRRDYREARPVVQERVYYPVQEQRVYAEPGVTVDVRVRP